MILTSPGDVLFDFGAVKIYYYGVIMAAAVLFGLLACKIICKKFFAKNDWEITYNLALGSIICGFFGARIYYVLASYNYFSNHLSEILAFHHGGMSIHGAILGGLFFSVAYLKIKKLPVLKYLDILSIGLVTGQIIGRWGNFFNSEAFGLPTFSFLKLYIPLEKRPEEFAQFDYFHPTFLYESLLNVILLIILLIITKKISYKKKKKDMASPYNFGYVTFTYILLYSLIRLFTEQLRLDSVLNFGDIPLAQVVSIIGILIGFIGIIILKTKNSLPKT